jgi:hypothetical protein
VDPSFLSQSSPFDEVIALTAGSDTPHRSQAAATLEKAVRAWAKKTAGG